MHEDGTVIEHWNIGVDFIFYGKDSELPGRTAKTKRSRCLRCLLQFSLVLVNTLMIQQILSEPRWAGRFTDREVTRPTGRY